MSNTSKCYITIRSQFNGLEVGTCERGQHRISALVGYVEEEAVVEGREEGEAEEEMEEEKKEEGEEEDNRETIHYHTVSF